MPLLPRLAAVVVRRVALCVTPVVLVAACQRRAPETAPTPAQAVDPATVAARAALASEQSLSASAIPLRTIAIPPLAVHSADTSLAPLGYGLADMLISDLARSAQVTVVERGRLDALLREMELVSAGAVDGASAPRIGKLLGARRLVVGALSDRGGGELLIDTRLANAVDGSITTAVSAHAPLAAIFDAEKALVYRLLEEMHVVLTPGERAAIEQRPTASVAGFLAYSRGVRDEAFGNYASAATNFRAAMRIDPSFDPARTHLTSVEARTGAGTESASSGATSMSGATAFAGSAINASPISTLGFGAASAQEAGRQHDHGAAPWAAPVATVIINVKQLP